MENLNINIEILSLLFMALSIFGGSYLAYLYGRKTKQFRWSEYIAIIIFPILFIILYGFLVNIRILSLFFVGSFVGFVSEYIIGLTYHKTLNRRLWTYGRLNIHGYTSLLAIPFWGIAGVFFWFLSKILGL